MRRTDSLEKTLMLGKVDGGRRRGRQDEMAGWHHQLDGHEFEQALELVKDREAWSVFLCILAWEIPWT